MGLGTCICSSCYCSPGSCYSGSLMMWCVAWWLTKVLCRLLEVTGWRFQVTCKGAALMEVVGSIEEQIFFFYLVSKDVLKMCITLGQQFQMIKIFQPFATSALDFSLVSKKLYVSKSVTSHEILVYHLIIAHKLDHWSSFVLVLKCNKTCWFEQ